MAYQCRYPQQLDGIRVKPSRLIKYLSHVPCMMLQGLQGLQDWCRIQSNACAAVPNGPSGHLGEMSPRVA